MSYCGEFSQTGGQSCREEVWDVFVRIETIDTESSFKRLMVKMFWIFYSFFFGVVYL